MSNTININGVALLNVTSAIENLNNSISKLISKREIEFMYDLSRAADFIEKGFNSFSNIEWTEKEAEVSSNFHTFLRKFRDDDISTILYLMLVDNKGKKVWHQFCKTILDYNFVVNKSFKEKFLHNIIEVEGENNEVIMKLVLLMWIENGLDEDAKEIKNWM